MTFYFNHDKVQFPVDHCSEWTAPETKWKTCGLQEENTLFQVQSTREELVQMISFLLFEDQYLWADCSLLCFYLLEYNMNGNSTAKKGLSETTDEYVYIFWNIDEK